MPAIARRRGRTPGAPPKSRKERGSRLPLRQRAQYCARRSSRDVEAVFEHLKLYLAIVAGSFTRLHVLANPMVKLVFLRQIYFTAVQSLRLLSIVALVVGATFVGQFTNILGSDSSLFDLVEVVLVR